MEIQAQRRIPDCQRQGGPAALLSDWKTHMTETHLSVRIMSEITLVAKEKKCNECFFLTNLGSEWTMQHMQKTVNDAYNAT